MRILVILALLIVFPAVAYAQAEGQVIVIDENGVVSIIDKADRPAKSKEEPKAKSENKSVSAPPPVTTKSVKKPEQKRAAPKQEAKKAPTKKASVKETKKETPKKKPSPKAEKKKSVPAKPVVQPPPPSAAPVQQRLGEKMTPEDAILIAVDAAPPSRSVNAYPVNYKGLHAYQVIFKSDEGDRSIFIDRETGRIVK